MVRYEEKVYRLELTLLDGTNPVELLLTAVEELVDANTEGASSFENLILSVSTLIIDGVSYRADFNLLDDDPVKFILVASGANSDQASVAACTLPAVDQSHGPNAPSVVDGFSIPTFKIRDGGPGVDGIPSLDSPVFTQNFSSTAISQDKLVIGVKVGDQVRAYPHEILDWHEIVNDQFLVNGQQQRMTLSYCPLTGSAMMWEASLEAGDPSYGVSGLLYNSNLILYDRRTRSLWSQMLEQAISGDELLRIPDRVQVVETTWGTWSRMYPNTELLSDLTDFSQPYGTYTYGS